MDAEFLPRCLDMAGAVSHLRQLELGRFKSEITLS